MNCDTVSILKNTIFKYFGFIFLFYLVLVYLIFADMGKCSFLCSDCTEGSAMLLHVNGTVIHRHADPTVLIA